MQCVHDSQALFFVQSIACFLPGSPCTSPLTTMSEKQKNTFLCDRLYCVRVIAYLQPTFMILCIIKGSLAEKLPIYERHPSQVKVKKSQVE